MSRNALTCTFCSLPTTRTDQRCDRCFKLEASIVSDSGIAALIIERLINSRPGFVFKLNLYRTQVDISIHLTDHSFARLEFEHTSSGETERAGDKQ